MDFVPGHWEHGKSLGLGEMCSVPEGPPQGALRVQFLVLPHCGVLVLCFPARRGLGTFPGFSRSVHCFIFPAAPCWASARGGGADAAPPTQVVAWGPGRAPAPSEKGELGAPGEWASCAKAWPHGAACCAWSREGRGWDRGRQWQDTAGRAGLGKALSAGSPFSGSLGATDGS